MFISFNNLFVQIALLLCSQIKFISPENILNGEDLRVVTVATETTDGFQRFNRSAAVNSVKVEVLGLHEPWKGGDITKHPGGGHKINLLKNFLKKYKNDVDKIVLFLDSYDVIILAEADKIVKKFAETRARVLFSAENFCWPDKSLETQYPNNIVGYRYLNSGGFIGYASDIYELVTSSPVDDLDDDQLFYTKIFLNETFREKFSIKLDHKANIFQNLNGAVGDVELRFNENGDSFVFNKAFNTEPLFVHGNGNSKVAINSLGNYLAKAWSLTDGCLACKENTISLKNLDVEEMPHVLVGLFIEHATPFISDFFETLLMQKYPKAKLSVIIHNAISYHDEDVKKFMDQHASKYQEMSALSSSYNERLARNKALLKCVEINCDYYFSIDSDVRLTNENTLTQLIEQNRAVIAPLVAIDKKLWSNFWGALSSDGYYARSHDYLDIVNYKRKGVWNVPYIYQIYLINGSLIKNGLKINSLESKKKYSYPNFDLIDERTLDADMCFAMSLRENGLFMFISNTEIYGYLISSDTYVTHHKHNDLYEIFANRLDWEKHYLHGNYSKIFETDYQMEQPCPDVYWFPVVSEKFTKNLIEELEHYGKWSEGKNDDPRLSGGYENVPTRDIHMNQIGFESQWLHILREFIRPVQEKIFIGYYHDPPRALMNFVVRYHPSEQPSLRPHHDSSTYTVNIALNRANVDYEGGGCRFIRYNCTLANLRVGWSLIHPGRLTHYHEGLPVTKGTRYIMVSFVDP